MEFFKEPGSLNNSELTQEEKNKQNKESEIQHLGELVGCLSEEEAKELLRLDAELEGYIEGEDEDGEEVDLGNYDNEESTRYAEINERYSEIIAKAEKILEDKNNS